MAPSLQVATAWKLMVKENEKRKKQQQEWPSERRKVLKEILLTCDSILSLLTGEVGMIGQILEIRKLRLETEDWRCK